MRKTRFVVAMLLTGLAVQPVPTFAAYSCRTDGEIHAECCCRAEACSSAEVDCSCCDVLQMEIKASQRPAPPLPGPDDAGADRAIQQEQPSNILPHPGAGFSLVDTSAEGLPPPPRIALCIQRI